MNNLFKFLALLCVLVAGSFAAPVDVNAENAAVDPTVVDHSAVPHTREVANAMAVGEATYYQTGLGSCGVTNNGAVEDIVALPQGLMGAQSNGNPFCGRRVMISYGGKQAAGVVQDKCMGCTGDNIDLSEHLFLKFAPLATGRISGVEWHFI